MGFSHFSVVEMILLSWDLFSSIFMGGCECCVHRVSKVCLVSILVLLWCLF